MANGGLIKWDDFTMVSFIPLIVIRLFSEGKRTHSVLLLMQSVSFLLSTTRCEYVLTRLVGTTALGHDFSAIEDDNSPFVAQYNEVMDGIASPLYVVLCTIWNNRFSESSLLFQLHRFPQVGEMVSSPSSYKKYRPSSFTIPENFRS